MTPQPAPPVRCHQTEHVRPEHMESTSTQKHTTTGVDLARIREAIAPVLSAHGISLVDLAWLTEQGGWVLRVTIEREGSIERGRRHARRYPRRRLA